VTGPHDELGDDDEEELDALVEPTTDLRTAQEQAAAETDSDESATGDADEEPESELDELLEPSTDLRTAQEREAAEPGSGGDDDSDGVDSFGGDDDVDDGWGGRDA